eukprot:NODE_1498_length_441_cov_183.850318_g1488_i0.p2 GENE.NODE_1498_length_441_cov_183.850318_g1488_i0~~NODE_1498_length_441_cov_183.850318_g1488_i0.p2  ORF type:complete len:76 (-),score=40.21 NODE_1498_length_441_cov_183.850318_g1488_i0:9-236(-)
MPQYTELLSLREEGGRNEKKKCCVVEAIGSNNNGACTYTTPQGGPEFGQRTHITYNHLNAKKKKKKKKKKLSGDT